MALREIDIDKTYKFTEDLKIIKHKNLNIVINTNGCFWLILDNDELKVFEYLKSNNSIEKALETFEQALVIKTLTQIEAKNFEKPCTKNYEGFGIYIYLTNNCNLRCKHCYMNSGEIDFNELDVEIWKVVLSDFKSLGGKYVTFSGGEILLYKGFEALIEYSKDIGLINILLSNGLLWNNAELIDRLAKYIDEIQISIDGHDADSYASVRGIDGFYDAMQTLLKFDSLGTRVSMAVTPILKDIDSFVNNFKGFIQPFMKANPEIYIKLSVELLNGRNVSITPEENHVYNKKLKALINEIYPDYYIANFVLNFENKSKMINCGFGGITISPNGDIYWCNRINELKSNMNIKTHSLIEIMQKSEEIKTKTSVDNVSECRNCPIKYVCGGGCRLDYKEFDIENLNFQNNCTQEFKENIYDKMIGSNEYFFSE